MTLILKLDLDMAKMYLHTKNEVSMLKGSKVIAWTDRNTDRQTHRQTHRHDQKHYLPAYAGGNDIGYTSFIVKTKVSVNKVSDIGFISVTVKTKGLHGEIELHAVWF